MKSWFAPCEVLAYTSCQPLVSPLAAIFQYFSLTQYFLVSAKAASPRRKALEGTSCGSSKRVRFALVS